MCGIVGIHSNSIPAAAVLRRIALAVGQLVHRGPDDGGVERVSGRSDGDEDRIAVKGAKVWDRDPIVIFGHRRLSILDLSAAGHQPMHDCATGNWITYNGEIYNFREIRAELLGRGRSFVTQCDTEVILKDRKSTRLNSSH